MNLKALTFKGGIHPTYQKHFTSAQAIEKVQAPGKVYIPMQQHIGAPGQATVKVGDVVKMGQRIGESTAAFFAPVHASVSGTVVEIKEGFLPNGNKAQMVVIENDGQYLVDESISPKGSIEGLTSEEIISIIKEAGIVGLGGAAFPTHIKLTPPKEKNIHTLIINGAECEPYLTADHRLMVEKAAEIVYGVKALKKALNVDKAVIGIEDNKMDAVEAVKQAIGEEQGIEIALLHTKYPQGGEKQLIRAIIKKEVPSGKLPMDVGVVVSNVGTACQVAITLKTGMPLVERVVTISGGAVAQPKNLLLPIGTTFQDAIEMCGGLKEEAVKIISGGPMMGFAQFDITVPVIKGTSGILCLTKSEVKIFEEQQCIRCGKCVGACPVQLQPLFLNRFARNGMLENAQEYHIADCIECGSCSYICPARIQLAQGIVLGKRKLAQQKKK